MNTSYGNRDWLEKQYWKELLSIHEIAKLCNVPYSKIQYLLKKVGIKARTKSQAKKLYFAKHPGIWVGDKSPRWKGGKKGNGYGYIYVYKPNHPHAYKGKYVPEHRLIMEKKLGGYLKPNEFVHHIDGNKTNNDESNLFLTTNSKHRKLHFSLMEIGYNLYKQGILKFKNGEYYL